MAVRSVVVMGGGVAGLSSALMLARAGWRVTLLERDGFPVGAPDDAPRWPRKGIPHFLQPHAFIPRGRLELVQHLPDVYEMLLSAGAHDVDVRRKLPGPAAPGDEAIQYVAVRRPVIEWALRRAALDEERIDVHPGVHVSGIGVESGRVVSVQVDGSALDAEYVVDALGRRSPTDAWLAAAGVAIDPAETSDCKVIYYSRYYRVRPGLELPDGPWFLSPRGDLGYFGYASFPGDNGTFAAILAVPTGVREWRVVRDEAVFEAAVAQIAPLRQWVDPRQVEPITDVLPMAGLTNTLRTVDAAKTIGLFPVGDALSHTDPVLAHGLAFALVHAAHLVAALEERSDPRDAAAAYAAATAPEIRERFDFATALDEQRHRLWMSEPVDFTRHDRDYALFSMFAAGAAATKDVEVARVFLRRIGLLESTSVLDNDVELQRRIEELYAEIATTPRPQAGPPRDEMLAVVASAAARS